MKIKHTAIIISIFFGFILSACGSSTARLLAEGNQAFEQQAYEQAMSKYNQANQQSPLLVEPIYNLANALYRLNAFQEASTYLTKAVEIASDELSVFSYFNLGNSFFQQQNLEEAITAYQEALRKNPADLDAKYNLELALQRQSEKEQNQDQQQEGSDSQAEQEQQSEQAQNPDDAQNQSGEGQNQQNADNQEIASDQSEEGSQDQSASNNTSSENNESDQENPGAIQGLTEEQARQILAAIANGSRTLQEKLQEIFTSPLRPPEKDW